MQIKKLRCLATSLITPLMILLSAHVAKADTDRESAELSKSERIEVLNAFKAYVTGSNNHSDIPRDWKLALKRLERDFVLITRDPDMNGFSFYTIYIANPDLRDFDSFGLTNAVGQGRPKHLYVYVNDNDVHLGLEHFPIPDSDGEGYDLIEETIANRIDQLTKAHSASHPRIQENVLRNERQRLEGLYSPIRSAVIAARVEAANRRIRIAEVVVRHGLPFSWAWREMTGNKKSCGAILTN